MAFERDLALAIMNVQFMAADTAMNTKPANNAKPYLPSCTLIQLHNSFAGGNSGQVGIDDVLLLAPLLDPDAAVDPVAPLDP